jgi:WD40 repeat protein
MAEDHSRSDTERLADEAPRTWKVGDVIADLYEVSGVLGEGAFGIVHKVHHRGWDMDLAVKSPKEEILGDELAVRRFLREAETWVSLGLHPHIASCYYVRNLGGIPRLFIEYVDGGTLRDWLHDGKVKDWHTVLDIAIQICYGLSFAHKKGLVHRDLKPGNCLMTSDGTLKITDFGLVKLLQAEELPTRLGSQFLVPGSSFQEPRTKNQELRTGLGRMGTPEYMAPEQWFSPAEATTAADIWAFGLIFYELTCGRRPFEMLPDEPVDAFYARMLKSNWAYRNPRELRDGVTKRQAEVIARCLAPRVEERAADIDVVAAEIDQLYSDLLVSSARRPPPEIPSLADTLNNQAVSLIDLGREEEALRLLDDALKVEPMHVHVTFNRSLILWRKGQITDVEALGNLKALREVRPQDHEVPLLIGLCHIERGDADSALKELEDARWHVTDVGQTWDARAVNEELELAEHMQLAGDSGRCLRTLEGHTGDVNSVCIRPGGRYGLSGCRDKTLRLWELGTGKCLRVLEGHAGPVSSVSISPDGQYALSGSEDKTLRLWELATGKCLRTFEGHTDSVRSACISPDGRYGLSGSNDKTLRLWELATGKCLRTLRGHTGPVNSVCVSPDGAYGLSSGGWDKTLRWWQLDTGTCLRAFEGHTGPVYSVCISSDGRHGLSGSRDRTLRLWELATGKCLRTFEGHTVYVLSVSISPDGRYGLSGGWQTLRLWELATGRCLRTFEGHTGGVISVGISSDGWHGLSGGSDGTLRLWTLRTGEVAAFSIVRPRPSAQVSVDEAAFRSLTADGERALKDGHPRQAAILLRQARQLPGHGRVPRALELMSAAGRNASRIALASAWAKELRGHAGVVSSVCISPDSRHGLSSSGEDRTLRVWELATGRCLRTFEDHANLESTSPDGRYGLSSRGKTLRLWELATGKYLQTFEGHSGGVTSACVSPDGRYGLSGSGDKTVRLWDLASGKCLRTLEGHAERVTSACVSPDGRYGLSGSGDKTVRLWDLASGKCLRTFEGHTAEVHSVSISPDGQFALSGGEDKMLRLWELPSGKCLRTLEGHADEVNSVCISPDGRCGLSGSGTSLCTGSAPSEDKTFRLWDLATGKCLRTLEGHTDGVISICISPDCRYGLSGSSDHTLRLWEFDWEYEFPGPKDWDEGARPYLEIFLTLHMRVGLDGISRVGKPIWNDDDFKKLLVELGYRGYGWLRPEGVRRQLERMTREWKGPRSISDEE